MAWNKHASCGGRCVPRASARRLMNSVSVCFRSVRRAGIAGTEPLLILVSALRRAWNSENRFTKCHSLPHAFTENEYTENKVVACRLQGA